MNLPSDNNNNVSEITIASEYRSPQPHTLDALGTGMSTLFDVSPMTERERDQENSVNTSTASTATVRRGAKADSSFPPPLAGPGGDREAVRAINMRNAEIATQCWRNRSLPKKRQPLTAKVLAATVAAEESDKPVPSHPFPDNRGNPSLTSYDEILRRDRSQMLRKQRQQNRLSDPNVRKQEVLRHRTEVRNHYSDIGRRRSSSRSVSPASTSRSSNHRKRKQNVPTAPSQDYILDDGQDGLSTTQYVIDSQHKVALQSNKLKQSIQKDDRKPKQSLRAEPDLRVSLEEQHSSSVVKEAKNSPQRSEKQFKKTVAIATTTSQVETEGSPRKLPSREAAANIRSIHESVKNLPLITSAAAIHIAGELSIPFSGETDTDIDAGGNRTAHIRSIHESVKNLPLITTTTGALPQQIEEEELNCWVEGSSEDLTQLTNSIIKQTRSVPTDSTGTTIPLASKPVEALTPEEVKSAGEAMWRSQYLEEKTAPIDLDQSLEESEKNDGPDSLSTSYLIPRTAIQFLAERTLSSFGDSTTGRIEGDSEHIKDGVSPLGVVAQDVEDLYQMYNVIDETNHQIQEENLIKSTHVTTELQESLFVTSESTLQHSATLPVESGSTSTTLKDVSTSPIPDKELFQTAVSSVETVPVRYGSLQVAGQGYFSLPSSTFSPVKHDNELTTEIPELAPLPSGSLRSTNFASGYQSSPACSSISVSSLERRGTKPQIPSVGTSPVDASPVSVSQMRNYLLKSDSDGQTSPIQFLGGSTSPISMEGSERELYLSTGSVVPFSGSPVSVSRLSTIGVQQEPVEGSISPPLLQSYSHIRQQGVGVSPIQTHDDGTSPLPMHVDGVGVGTSPIQFFDGSSSPIPVERYSKEAGITPVGRQDGGTSPFLLQVDGVGVGTSPVQFLDGSSSPFPVERHSKEVGVTPVRRQDGGTSPLPVNGVGVGTSPVQFFDGSNSPIPVETRSKEVGVTPVRRQDGGTSPLAVLVDGVGVGTSPVQFLDGSSSPIPIERHSKEVGVTPVRRQDGGTSPLPVNGVGVGTSPVQFLDGSSSPFPVERHSKDVGVTPVRRQDGGTSPLAVLVDGVGVGTSPVQFLDGSSSPFPVERHSKEVGMTPVRRQDGGTSPLQAFVDHVGVGTSPVQFFDGSNSPIPVERYSKEVGVTPVRRQDGGTSPLAVLVDGVGVGTSPVQFLDGSSSPFPVERRSKEVGVTPVRRQDGGTSPLAVLVDGVGVGTSPVQFLDGSSSPFPVERRSKEVGITPVRRQDGGTSPLPMHVDGVGVGTSPVQFFDGSSSPIPVERHSKEVGVTPVRRQDGGTSPLAVLVDGVGVGTSPVQFFDGSSSPIPIEKHSKEAGITPVKRQDGGTSPLLAHVSSSVGTSPVEMADGRCSPISQKVRETGTSPTVSNSTAVKLVDRSNSPFLISRTPTPVGCQDASNSPMCDNVTPPISETTIPAGYQVTHQVIDNNELSNQPEIYGTIEYPPTLMFLNESQRPKRMQPRPFSYYAMPSDSPSPLSTNSNSPQRVKCQFNKLAERVSCILSGKEDISAISCIDVHNSDIAERVRVNPKPLPILDDEFNQAIQSMKNHLCNSDKLLLTSVFTEWRNRWSLQKATKVYLFNKFKQWRMIVNAQYHNRYRIAKSLFTKWKSSVIINKRHRRYLLTWRLKLALKIDDRKADCIHKLFIFRRMRKYTELLQKERHICRQFDSRRDNRAICVAFSHWRHTLRTRKELSAAILQESQRSVVGFTRPGRIKKLKDSNDLLKTNLEREQRQRRILEEIVATYRRSETLNNNKPSETGGVSRALFTDSSRAATSTPSAKDQLNDYLARELRAAGERTPGIDSPTQLAKSMKAFVHSLPTSKRRTRCSEKKI